jgi:hypothetical protein
VNPAQAIAASILSDVIRLEYDYETSTLSDLVKEQGLNTLTWQGLAEQGMKSLCWRGETNIGFS